MASVAVAAIAWMTVHHLFVAAAGNDPAAAGTDPVDYVAAAGSEYFAAAASGYFAAAAGYFDVAAAAGFGHVVVAADVAADHCLAALRRLTPHSCLTALIK
jgi:hypothetical protein